MSFQSIKGGFEFKRDKCELVTVSKESIVKITAFTDDLFAYDEHVIEVELADGLFYKFMKVMMILCCWLNG